MKQGEWYGLCKREQGNGGEIVGVTLTPRGAQELANEVSAEAGAIAAWLDGDAPAEGGRDHVVAGARVGSLVNWAAKTVVDVDIDPDSEVDTLTVRYVQTRTIPVDV